jgi:hypothetical protein
MQVLAQSTFPERCDVQEEGTRRVVGQCFSEAAARGSNETPPKPRSSYGKCESMNFDKFHIQNADVA